MNYFFTIIGTECQKIIKSKLFYISAISVLLLPPVCGLFTLIPMHPDLAHQSGLITQKAKVISAADWPSYLRLIAQMIAVGGIILFGFIVSWTFGREYSDGTAKDLLALPLSRSLVIGAKFIAVALWTAFLALVAFLTATVIGLLIQVPAFDIHSYLGSAGVYAVCSLMVISLSLPIAFFACFGKGYLPPLGFLVLALFLGNIIATMGHGAYFPWSIPAIYSGAAGAETLPVASYTIIFLIGLIGLIGLMATFVWWRYADQK
ncbi:ABC transporter permease [Desulfitobacterium sp. AusDCA]|uniref:ABC transporter permease n=1 Tax=Desulfitobacterium sp. AusDCA TaxID=3240383 RepID=UPI003DA7A55E